MTTTEVAAPRSSGRHRERPSLRLLAWPTISVLVALGVLMFAFAVDLWFVWLGAGAWSATAVLALMTAPRPTLSDLREVWS